LKTGQIELAIQLHGDALVKYPSEKLMKLPMSVHQRGCPVSNHHERI